MFEQHVEEEETDATSPSKSGTVMGPPKFFAVVILWSKITGKSVSTSTYQKDPQRLAHELKEKTFSLQHFALEQNMLKIRRLTLSAPL